MNSGAVACAQLVGKGRQPENSAPVMEGEREGGEGKRGIREQEDQRGRKARAVSKPVSLNHLLSVCLLSALFSLSQESNGFSTVLFPNL